MLTAVLSPLKSWRAAGNEGSALTHKVTRIQRTYAPANGHGHPPVLSNAKATGHMVMYLRVDPSASKR